MNPEIQQIMARLDVIEQKLGIQSNSVPNKDEYMKANNDGRDKMDEQQILGKT